MKRGIRHGSLLVAAVRSVQARGEKHLNCSIFVKVTNQFKTDFHQAGGGLNIWWWCASITFFFNPLFCVKSKSITMYATIWRFA